MSGIKFQKNHHNKKDETIYRDEWGVPHIYGKYDTDVAFGLAYANAEDNLDNIIFSLSEARENQENIMVKIMHQMIIWFNQLVCGKFQKIRIIYQTIKLSPCVTHMLME